MRELVVVALIVLAGCNGTPPASGPDTPAKTTMTPDQQPNTTVVSKTETADSDTIGVEGGISATADIGVDTSDGINLTEQNRIVQRTMARVELIRGVEFESPVIVEVESRASFRDSVAEQYDSDSERLRFAATRYEALFLVPPGENRSEFLQQEKSNAVAGFYSPERDRITLVVERGPYETGLDNVSELLLAHELVHVLQARRHGADVLRGRPLSDHSRAAGSVVEGEATFLTSMYRERCRSDWNCVGIDSSSDRGHVSNPAVVLYRVFPYTIGSQYVEHQYRAEGWAGVDALLENPPSTTRTVLHPDVPESSSLSRPDLPRPANESWTRIQPNSETRTDELGASAIAVLLSEAVRNRTVDSGPALSRPLSAHYDKNLTRAWAGDSFAVYQNSANETAYVWRIEWRTADAATAFARAYTEVLQAHGATQNGRNGWVVANASSTYDGHYRVEIDDRTVTIANEPRAGVLNLSAA